MSSFDLPSSPLPDSPKSQLGLWDAVSLIVGIVVGAAILEAPTIVFSSLNCAWAAFGVWALGGVLSLIGAFCYAELATTYPRSGGDYIYLTRAYGPFVGFLFGWSHLAGILTGSIGALAFVFADHSIKLFALDSSMGIWFAISAVAALSLLNIFGLVLGKTAQNILTILKTLGLVGVIVMGIGWGIQHGVQWKPTNTPADFNPNWGLAFIMVLYAFGGWNDASFVAAEVKDRERNLPRALIGGVTAITIIYLLINLGYLMGLGFDEASNNFTPAAAVVAKPFGAMGGKAMLLLVMVSALGGVNGLVLTGSRVHASLGADHRVLNWLGRWHPRWNAPVASLITQALVSISLMLLLGTTWGRGQLDLLNDQISTQSLDWKKFGSGFQLLVATTAPVFWSFFFLTGTAVMVLRFKDRNVPRPFRVPFFPVLPILFCGMCGYMLYRSVLYAGTLALIPLVPLVAGIGLYLVNRTWENHNGN